MMDTSSIFRQLLVGAFLAAVGLPLQIDTPRVPPEEDLSDLYLRMAASRVVLVGTAQKSEGVTKRLSPELLEKMKTSLEHAVGGSRYTIRVEEVLCRQSDFDTGPAALNRASESYATVEIFVPRGEPEWTGGHQKQFLFEGRRYLLFLVQPEQPKQKETTAAFQLDPKHIYFRAEEGSRGVVPLVQPTAENPTPKQPLVLEKVTRLCEAVRPPRVQDKLAALKKLAASDDPVLQREADIAANALRSKPSPPHK